MQQFAQCSQCFIWWYDINVNTRCQEHQWLARYVWMFFWPYAKVVTPSSRIYLLSSNAFRHALLISTVRRTWLEETKVRKVLGVGFKLCKTFKNCSCRTFLLMYDFLTPFTRILDCLGLSGTSKLYILLSDLLAREIVGSPSISRTNIWCRLSL